MKITRENIGDIICKYNDGKRIMITGVDSKLVHYKNESWGGAYCTDQFEINGTIDRTPGCAKAFVENQEYAATLDFAESSALKRAIDGNRFDIEEAEEMLSLVFKQKEDFKQKLNLEADKRKETLVNSFQQDFFEMVPGSKVKFYGTTVEKASDNKGVIIDGELCTEDSLKNHLLGTFKAVQKKHPSLSDLLSSAEKRSGNQNHDNKEIHKNKVDIDRS